MRRESHVRFCESLQGKFLWATRLTLFGPADLSVSFMSVASCNSTNNAAECSNASLLPLGDKSRGDVFLSYKREEVKNAERVRACLEESGFTVWWDRDIQCGQVWSEVLDNAVKRTGCIVVLWSMQSVRSRWVMHEASSAFDRGVYAPVRIDLCDIEAPYNRIQATDILH